jgi:CO/xanthine dehydrogenase Mo-binding subunit
MVSRRPDTTRTGVPYIASFAEVEVDTATGRTQVLKLIIINDAGTVMYASGAESQQIGGQVMAIGEALTEEIIYDPLHGVPLNFNFIDYKMPPSWICRRSSRCSWKSGAVRVSTAPAASAKAR